VVADLERLSCSDRKIPEKKHKGASSVTNPKTKL